MNNKAGFAFIVFILGMLYIASGFSVAFLIPTMIFLGLWSGTYLFPKDI